jgi:hypothetical protein
VSEYDAATVATRKHSKLVCDSGSRVGVDVLNKSIRFRMHESMALLIDYGRWLNRVGVPTHEPSQPLQ